MSTNPNRTPAWLIERLALGELPPREAVEVRARLRAEGRDVDEVLAEVAASNRAVLEEMPKRQMAASIRARAEAGKPARRPRAWMLALPTLGMAAAVALMVVRLPPERDDPRIPARRSVPENTTDKGYTRLVVYRQRSDHSELVPRGARAARGDLLQVAYVAERPSYGVVLSLDGAGRVTVHLPSSDGGHAVPLTVSRQTRLPRAYELDDAPRFERFFLVTADGPFPVSQVVEAARALASKPTASDAPLPLPAQFSQASFRIEKTRENVRKEQP